MSGQLVQLDGRLNRVLLAEFGQIGKSAATSVCNRVILHHIRRKVQVGVISAFGIVILGQLSNFFLRRAVLIPDGDEPWEIVFLGVVALTLAVLRVKLHRHQKLNRIFLAVHLNTRHLRQVVAHLAEFGVNRSDRLRFSAGRSVIIVNLLPDFLISPAKRGIFLNRVFVRVLIILVRRACHSLLAI